MSLHAGDARAPTAAPVAGPSTEQPPPAWIGGRLLQLGLITQDQLEVALIEQGRCGRRLGTVLVDLGFINQDVLASQLAESSGDEQLDPKVALADHEVVIRLPQEVAPRHRVPPLASEGSRESVATCGPYDLALRLPPAELRARLRQGQALRWASAGLAASALGFASWSALSVVAALQVDREIGWLSAAQATTRQQLARAEGDAARLSARDEAIRAVLEAHRRLEGAAGSPLAALATLRQAMSWDERLTGLAWRLVDPADGAHTPADGPVTPAADFTLDLTLDLGLAVDPAAAVAATEGLARRLVEAFPDRPVGIIRQAVDMVPHQALVGSAGAPLDPGGRLSAELHIGTRWP